MILIIMGKSLCQSSLPHSSQTMQTNVFTSGKTAAESIQIAFSSNKPRTNQASIFTFQKLTSRIKILWQHIVFFEIYHCLHVLIQINHRRKPLGKVRAFGFTLTSLLHIIPEFFTCLSNCLRKCFRFCQGFI